MDGGALQKVSLDDKYTLDSGRVFISGVQALVRLPLMQRARDRARGLNTAGFISGYRGSPLGGYDAALWQAARRLEAGDILFRPGINEDLAMAAVWGTQQLDFVPGRKVDGVFAIWYGKGPGVDRTGDAFKHANFAGSHPNGGVLVVCGDDHTGKSSSMGHQSDQAMIAANIPLLYPASVQDYLDFGLHGFALSRFAGTLAGFKTVNETVTATATVSVDPSRVSIVLPKDAPEAPEGVHIRPEYDPQGQDNRVVRYKLPRAQAYVRANRLDGPVFGAERPTRLGIVTAGKAVLDTLAGLRLLGIDETMARALGVGVYKAALVWPLEPEGLAAFAADCAELLFVEEKRPVMEDQAKALFYNRDPRPAIVGKRDGAGRALLPSDEPIEAAMAAAAIGDRLETAGVLDSARVERLAALRARLGRNLPALSGGIERSPFFCSGCPHNTSTKVPEGSLAMAGIGCHGMALLVPERNTLPVPHMGAEGVPWTGMAPFTETPHIFQNLGDGTYVHSGSLGIRAAVQSGANVTYKILYNDAVAMTGGQPVEGAPSVGVIARQLLDEGVRTVVVVSDDPGKFEGLSDLPAGVRVRHRDALDEVQRDLRPVPGVTAIVYEQTCAAEKRRRRKRGAFPDPQRRVFIDPLVCEGCGDCSTQANCVSIHPLETEFGRKRRIDQSSCNKDYSCLKGFCPSFVTVVGGGPRKPAPAAVPDDAFDSLPDPTLPAADPEWDVLIAGVGGTGVITVGAVLGMAAHIEGKGASVFDMTGLSQKNGAVYSHLKIAADPETQPAAGIGLGEADLLLGCDIVAATAPVAVRALEPGRTLAVLNTTVTPPPGFQLDADMKLDGGFLARGLAEHVGDERVRPVEATRIALALTGDTIGANTFMVGHAFQSGGLPLSAASIEEAIGINGVAVAFNIGAFRLGRLAAHDPDAVRALMPRAGAGDADGAAAPDLDAMVARRAAFLAAWQNEAYAERYRAAVAAARAAEARLGRGEAFAAAVARGAFKLMAYKDEYEVARLFADSGFRRRIDEAFEGDFTLRFHLAPPLLAGRDANTGRPKKREYGAWMLWVFRALAACRGLRGTRWDPFGYTAERRAERRIRDRYLTDVERLAAGLTPDTLALAVEIAALPERIRGYGPVKEKAIGEAEAERARLFAALEEAPARRRAA